MDLTKYAALNIKITKFSKVNSQFSLGRARVFYEGPNVNRTIIDADDEWVKLIVHENKSDSTMIVRLDNIDSITLD